jgi:hypothetical protein
MHQSILKKISLIISQHKVAHADHILLIIILIVKTIQDDPNRLLDKSVKLEQPQGESAGMRLFVGLVSEL